MKPELRQHIGLVVSPLRSLMIDQQKRWTDQGIKSGCILKMSEMTSDQIDDITGGKCSVVFTSLELICRDPWRSMLRSDIYKTRLSFLACDEAHCIIEWGDDFRPEYKQVSVLRSLITCPVVMLTATATEAMRHKILTNLLLNDSMVKTVAVIPDRPNIFLHYKSEPAMTYERELTWVIDTIKRDGQNAKKVIIYCRTIKDVADIYEHFISELGEQAWSGENKCVNNRLVDMYHSSVDEATEKRIVEVFPSENSVIKCLISTVTFGMGILVKDVPVDTVIHWGMSKSILLYWQEIGRCGRDGRQAEAYLFATKRSLDKLLLLQIIVYGTMF
ncbi:ATP-dependent DNA helicase RecQ-like [Ptychodera flava]|uniref:ATP-dependent DNA helicase RecQ-like n=1 Tax=Ptychodera flava TaxID=63121 RepID=UPI00396A86A9